MTAKRRINYRDTGVLDNTALGLQASLTWVAKIGPFRNSGVGRKVVDVGFFASVIHIGHGLGLTLCPTAWAARCWWPKCWGATTRSASIAWP